MPLGPCHPCVHREPALAGRGNKCAHTPRHPFPLHTHKLFPFSSLPNYALAAIQLQITASGPLPLVPLAPNRSAESTNHGLDLYKVRGAGKLCRVLRKRE